MKGIVNWKLMSLAALICISWIASMFVWAIVQDRSGRETEASEKIAAQWGKAQVVSGPILTVPIEKVNILSTGERTTYTETLVVLPRDLAYESTLVPEMRSRGIYHIPVYTADVKVSGTFDFSMIQDHARDGKIIWEKAMVSVHTTDTRGIVSSVKLRLGTDEYVFLPSSQAIDVRGIHTPINLRQSDQEMNFAFDMSLRGTKDISFVPLGEHTRLAIASSWNVPNFIGAFLPENRTVEESGFSAVWNIASYGKDVPQTWIDRGEYDQALLEKSFGVALYEEVDLYTMIDRAAKYSILFISLTFLAFFMYEVLSGLRLHPVQYLLVGLGIALFYLLLLSFAEVIGFAKAYLLSTIAITGLITGYSLVVLRARKRAFSIMCLLLALYAYLFVLLQLEEYALLSGAVLLFGVLGVVMYLTRNIDWYSIHEKR